MTPPCIWTFLSSLGENEFFSILLNLAVSARLHSRSETQVDSYRYIQLAGSGHDLGPGFLLDDDAFRGAIPLGQSLELSGIRMREKPGARAEDLR